MMFGHVGFVRNSPNHRQPEEQQNSAGVFHECDAGHKNYLDREDLKVAVVTLFGYKPSKYEVDQMMTCAQHEGHVPGLTFKEFESVMSNKMAAIDEDEEIRQTFMTFDGQCKGFLTLEDLKKAFAQVAPHLSLQTIECAFREVDRDGDGRVSYLDFEFMMKYSTVENF